jgi:hypothetical protein
MTDNEEQDSFENDIENTDYCKLPQVLFKL